MQGPRPLEANPASASSARSYEAAPVLRAEHKESSLARLVEHQTAKIPSEVFLVAALGSMTVSLLGELTGRPRLSRLVGMWPGPLLVMGVYNKLVKMFGPR
jgi:hypothetical protein